MLSRPTPEFCLQTITGFLLVRKSVGMTSFDCVRRFKRLLGKGIKIGHAGTLDKFASGLLIVGIGRVATREFVRLSKYDKVYRATGALGYLTTTFDPEGPIIKKVCGKHVTKELLEQAITQLGQEYEQVPPIYSALQYQGKRLYEIARAGTDRQELEQVLKRKKRMVILHNVALEQFNPQAGIFTIHAHVSHGTYIRSLVHDLAQRVGSCATTVALERVKIGGYSVEDAVPLEQFKTVEDIAAHCRSLEEFL